MKIDEKVVYLSWFAVLVIGLFFGAALNEYGYDQMQHERNVAINQSQEYFWKMQEQEQEYNKLAFECGKTHTIVLDATVYGARR